MHVEPLHTVLILLAAAVLLVAVFRSLHLSSILGYLMVGIVLGPHTLGWLEDTENTRLLAELGIVFLMFTVGLEFSIPVLLASRRTVLGLGSAQVITTALLAGIIGWTWGLTPAAALTVGGAVAMSSTAIVVKQLGEQMELNVRYGQLAVGILLFQDLATLPFLLLLPKLADDAGILDLATLLVLAKGTAVFLLLAVLGRRVVRPLFHWIATRRTPELFMLTVLLTVLSAAALADIAELSPPLGAFLAGMVLGETEFRHQIESDIRPFQEVLIGLFFATVGMSLDPHVVFSSPLTVLGLALVLIVAKALLITFLARIMGEHPGVAARVGLILGQGGEFGLLLVSMGLGVGVLKTGDGQILLAALIVSMAMAPLLIRHSGTLIQHVARLNYQSRLNQIDHRAERQARDLRDHVIIVGYGRMGQNLGQLLCRAEIPFIALDLDPERIRMARAAGESVIYGNALREALLRATGIERAAALVITIKSVQMALRIVETARQLNTDLAILVRTRDDACLEALSRAGATEVLPEGLESSLMVGSQLLRWVGISEIRIDELLAQVRADRYKPLRRFFHAKNRPYPEGVYQEHLNAITVPAEAHTIGQPLNELALDQDNVTVMSLIRDGVHNPDPEPEESLREGDVLLLSGPPGALEAAEEKVRTGEH